jgi:hypothetical protein
MVVTSRTANAQVDKKQTRDAGRKRHKANRLKPCPKKLKKALDFLAKFPSPFFGEYDAWLANPETRPSSRAKAFQYKGLTPQQRRFLKRKSHSRGIGRFTYWIGVWRAWEEALEKLTAGVRQFEIETFLTVDREGKVRIRSGYALEILESVEVRRIRRCPLPTCRRFYWAGRIDKPACSPKCQDAWRKQQWRANYKNRYKERRILGNIKASASFSPRV